MVIFDDILTNIELQNEINTIIYIAVGSSALQVVYDDKSGTWSIPKNLEQQYPPFLATLKTHNFMFPTHIVLIDGLLEDPPFVICDSKKNVSDDWCYNGIWYFNIVTNTYVYPIRVNVTYPPYNDPSDINICDFLQKLNMKAIEKNWFVVFNDFCGRNVGLLAECFDTQISGHHDHIIYGGCTRCDGGCFLDLMGNECQFEYQFDGSSIKAFNPFAYKNFDRLDTILNSTQSEIIKFQILAMKENVKNFFKTHFFSLVRQAWMLKEGHDVKLHKFSYSYVENLCYIDITSLLDTKQFDVLFDVIMKVFKQKIIEYINEYKFDEIMCMMKCEKDVYNWQNYLNRLFE